MSGTAAAQRGAFADVAEELGPDAPTLIPDWSTKELVAHCYVREHRPDAAPGVLPLGPLSAYTERVMASALRVHGFADLVRAVRTPPAWVRPFDDAANTVEFFVHTEDARRANGREPRPVDDALEAWVWRRLARQARFMFRRVPATVRLIPQQGSPVEVGRRSDAPTVELRGRPTELLLLAYNRKDAADVRVDGAADLLMNARLGL